MNRVDISLDFTLVSGMVDRQINYNTVEVVSLLPGRARREGFFK